ncbi:MAG: proton-conducting transporter membrane subunit, partial [Ornithinimicrobium sp.]
MNWLPWPDITLPHLPGFSLPIPPVPDLPWSYGTPAQWMVLIPLIAALVAFCLPDRFVRVTGWGVIGAGLAGLVVALWQVYRTQELGEMSAGTIGALPWGEVEVPLMLSVGTLGAVTATVIALVVLIVQAFSRWYLWYDPRYRQFAATVALFTAAMMLVVHSGDVIITLIGWEVMGWCSFLLIGHYSTKASAGRAASKALIVTRVADVGFVLGLVALAAGARSTSIEAILEHWSERSGTALTVALLLIIIGVAGKSALFPFQDWLPDAMEGPTPASALIHAATMVAAGTVVLAQLFDLLQASDPARLTLAVLAAGTTLLAALLAFAQPDLKRLLAWSTVSQVALMLAALSAIPLGAGADAALLHLMSHAVFKALLFLTMGWLAVLTGGTLVAYAVSGARRYASVKAPLGLGLLALAGVPPFVGFFSKELILSAAEAGAEDPGAGAASVVVLVAMGAGAPLTAAYCMRAWLILNRPIPVNARSVPLPGNEEIDDFFADPDVMAQAIGVEEAESAISSTARAGITVLTLAAVLGSILPFTAFVDVELTFNLPLLLASLG